MLKLLYSDLEKTVILFDIEITDIRFIFQQMRLDEEGLGINEEV